MPRQEILGLTRITKKRILELCRKNKLYQTPELNDVLYLHYQGFDAIECLEEYTELKCLWLESNAISEIQGLDKQTKLKCLYLQSNLIRKIENLEYCKELDTLNLSQNHIRKIENCGFEVLPVLNTLNLASNYLRDCESLKELEHCKNLSVLDLNNNRIDDILVVKIFALMPELKVLVLQGNPVVSKIPQYRKTLILECKKLTYLDSRPVFLKDRACAEAWKRGGYEEERKENERWNRKERKKMRDSVNATIHLRNTHRKLDDQILLIPSSSDSEDDTNKQKMNLKIQGDSEACMDGIWDEVVTQDKNSDKSLISESSNDQETIDGSNVNEKEKEERKEENEQNSSCGVEGTESLFRFDEDNDSQETDQIDLEKDYQKNYEVSNELIRNTTESDILFEKPIKVTEHKLATVLTSASSNDQEIVDINANEEEKREENEIHEILQKPLSCRLEGNIALFSPDGNKDFKEANQIDHQENYGFNEAMENTIEHDVLIEKQIKNPNTPRENNEENYEPLKELEKTMNIFSQEVSYKQSSKRHKIKTQIPNRQQLEIEKCIKINDQLKTDFDELTSNLSNIVNKLEKEQVQRQEVMKALFNKEVAAKEESSCESSDNENEESSEKLKLQRMVDQWDNVSKINIKSNKNKVLQMIMNKEQIRINHTEELRGDNVSNKEIELITTFAVKEGTYNKELARESEYIPINISLLASKSNESLNSVEKESHELKQLLKKLENKNEVLFKDISLDLKHQEDKGFEEEENREAELDFAVQEIERKHLLENKNQELFKDISLEIKHQEKDSNFEKEENQKLEVGFIGKQSERETLLENNTEELFKGTTTDIKYQETDKGCEEEEKQKAEHDLTEKRHERKNLLDKNTQEDVKENKEINHKYNDSIKRDYDLEENVTEDTGDQNQIASKIIEEILQMLNFKPKSYKFPNDLTESNEVNEEASHNAPSSKTISAVVQSFTQFFDNTKVNYQKEKEFDKQKSLSLKELSQQTNLKQFNSDTLQSLDAQLETTSRKQHEKVRRMVDRVYARKDSYNDTIELVDGKLMVRNRETKELRELPRDFQRHLSDSEEDYDTAQSEEDENNGKENLRKERIPSRSYKPIVRRANEELIIQVLNTNRTKEDSSDENEDEFFSLDGGHDKQKLYDIDKEFLNKLPYDFANLTQIDEDRIVQCAKSYRELNHCLAPANKEQRCLTREESELLENMAKTKFNNFNEKPEKLLKALQNNNDSSREETLEPIKMSLKYEEPKTTCSNKCNIEKNLETTKDKQILSCIFEPLHEKKHQASHFVAERQSEEEKNEFENNIDFEFNCNEKTNISKEKSQIENQKENNISSNEEAILQKVSENSCGVEALECNLEIFADNDEIVDSLAVNAELHFQY